MGSNIKMLCKNKRKINMKNTAIFCILTFVLAIIVFGMAIKADNEYMEFKYNATACRVIMNHDKYDIQLFYNGKWNYYTTMDCEKKSKTVCEYRIKRNKNKNKVLFYIGDKK